MKYTERDSFLFNLTLTEITFVIFMIFLLFFMNHLHQKQQVIEKQTEENEKLIAEIAVQKKKATVCEEFSPLIEQDPDKFYSMLSNYPALNKEIRKLKEENETLKNENKSCSLIAKAIDDYNKNVPPEEQIKLEELPELIPAAREINRLAKELGIDPTKLSKREIAETVGNNLKDKFAQFENIIDQCKDESGFGPPPCWLTKVDGKKKAEYIYSVVINESTLDVKQNWPSYREVQVKTIPGAYDILQDKLSVSEFKRFALPLLNWSKEQNPECRHYVLIIDHAETKDSFKRKLLTIEEYFYKYLPSGKQNDEQQELLVDLNG